MPWICLQKSWCLDKRKHQKTCAKKKNVCFLFMVIYHGRLRKRITKLNKQKFQSCGLEQLQYTTTQPQMPPFRSVKQLPETAPFKAPVSNWKIEINKTHCYVSLPQIEHCLDDCLDVLLVKKIRTISCLLVFLHPKEVSKNITIVEG